MSISGSLEDVSVAEVMQFIHLGGRTGTLVIRRQEERAEVGFHRGRIISAWTPSTRRLGDLLLAEGLVTQDRLAEALAQQEGERPRRSLGRILIGAGAIAPEAMRDAVASQIERTVYELVSWREGTFEFAVDELRPVDDIAVYPGDILPDINLNTQMLVLEALRIFDEKHRQREPPGEVLAGAEAGGAPEEGRGERSGAGAESDIERSLESLRPLPEAARAAAAREARATRRARVHVVSSDPGLVSDLSQALSTAEAEVARVEVVDAGLTLPGESPPIVVVDLRAPGTGLEAIRQLRRGRPRASLVVVLDDPEAATEVYGAGALAALPASSSAVAACLETLIRSRGDETGDALLASDRQSGFAKLKRVVADLRSGLLSATVALNLMNVISESVERAIMFLVRGQQLVALGAFGFTMDGRPLARMTQSLHLDLDEVKALGRAIEDGQTRSLKFEDVGLPPDFAALVGRPRTGQVVIFPVLGSEQVISVVYSDNGHLSREIEEIEILELAAAQVGVAFENELLRRRMTRGG